MFSIASTLVSRFYKPEGHQCVKCSTHSRRDELVFGIPEKLAYLDMVTGVALVIVGALALHHIMGINGANYFIVFGSVQLFLGLIYKSVSVCCPICCGPFVWDNKPCFGDLKIINGPSGNFLRHP